MLTSLGLKTRPDFRGWRALKPGPLHWTGVGLGSALTGLFGYIWLFVGSSRPDAERQMTILFWLILAFGIGVLVVGFSIRRIARQSVRWRGDSIAFESPQGKRTFRFDDVSGLRKSPWGSVVLSFGDGTTLPLDPYATSAGDLIDGIAAHLEARQTPPD